MIQDRHYDNDIRKIIRTLYQQTLFSKYMHIIEMYRYNRDIQLTMRIDDKIGEEMKKHETWICDAKFQNVQTLLHSKSAKWNLVILLNIRKLLSFTLVLLPLWRNFWVLPYSGIVQENTCPYAGNKIFKSIDWHGFPRSIIKHILVEHIIIGVM